MSNLSHEQARFFRDSGYFKLKNVLTANETARLREFVSTEKSAEDAERVRRGMGGTAVKLYGLYDRNPALVGSLVCHPKLIKPLTSLVGPNVVFVKNRHNHATVNDGEGTKNEARLHRDILQPTRGLLTAAVYLEESTVENGCTRIVPGSHNLPFVGVPQENGGGTWMGEHAEYAGLEEQALPVPMSEGDVLLFNGLAFHGVGYNETDRTRMSITLGFRAADELDYIPDAARQLIVSGEYLYRGNDLS